MASHPDGAYGADADTFAARSLGWLFFAGATIGAISMLLPHPAAADDLALWSNIALAYGGGVALFALASRLPRWGLHAALAGGSILITRAVLSSGDPVSFYTVWFIWVGLYAFYFLSRSGAALHVAFAAALYAFTLVVDPPGSEVARWLTTVATLVVAGILIDRLVARARWEASAAASTADVMARIAGVAHDLGRLSDSPAVRRELCRAAASLSGASTVGLWEPSADGATLVLKASVGVPPSEHALPFVAAPAGAPRAFATGVTVTSGDPADAAQETPEFRGAPDSPLAAVWQPVMHGDAPRGVLAFYFTSPAGALGAPLLTLARLLATEADATLSRVELLERLEATARTDDLTGLANRRAWDEYLPRELAHRERDGRPLCVAMLDLDNFKQFNDEHGHQAGDRLLKQAAAAWAQQLRATDLLARYGGEEFALVLPACPLEDALRRVERLRDVTPGDETCSAGIACWDGSETPAELLARADAALYEAKRRGRDRTVTADSGSTHAG